MFAFFFASSEYYFSIENLGADIFLRQQMSKDGYVPLSLIASFNRVQTLCDDINFIAEVCFNKDFLRKIKVCFFCYV
jgi:la-related protein 1